MCQVDIAYVPFIERLEIAFSGLKNYDVTAGRPNLAKWLKVIFFVSSLCAKWVIVNVCKFMSLFEYQNCLYIVGYSPKNGCFPSSLNNERIVHEQEPFCGMNRLWILWMHIMKPSWNAVYYWIYTKECWWVWAKPVGSIWPWNRWVHEVSSDVVHWAFPGIQWPGDDWVYIIVASFLGAGYQDAFFVGCPLT